ncbi:MAG TPA: Imm10 family immunity protein [Longimicrobium sp.]|nr:Imm10 family immunity protein [Longimicrobium sp.]
MPGLTIDMEEEMKRFNATAVAVEELPELNTFTVVLAEAREGGERLELHKAISFDEQDRALRIDTYCLCTETGTVYGGVTSWTVAPGTLEVRLDARAAEMLDVEGGFRVTFPPESMQDLASGLRRVLG